MIRNSYFIKLSSDYPSYPHTVVSSLVSKSLPFVFKLLQSFWYINCSELSVPSDSGPGRPPAHHRGKCFSAGGLEGQRGWSEGLLAYLGQAAKLSRQPTLLPLPSTRFSVDTPHTPTPLCQSLCVSHLPNSEGGWTVLHSTVSLR